MTYKPASGPKKNLKKPASVLISGNRLHQSVAWRRWEELKRLSQKNAIHTKVQITPYSKIFVR